MPQKKQDKSVVLYAAAVLLLCLGGVFAALLWWRRNDRLACRPSPHSHHAPKMENYAEPEPNPSSTSGHLSTELEAGCHQLMPTGCDKPHAPKGLFRDPAGDANADQCTTRNAAWNEYCTRNDAEWLYVGKRSKDMYRHPGPAPKTQGCWVANPTGCPEQSWNPDVNSYKWYDPTAGGSPQKCAMRQQTINNDCGKTDALMVYNQDPGPAPETQGCRIAMPSGCPKQSWNPDVNSYKWFDPTEGGSPEKCAMRRQTIDNDCGKTDAMMVYRGSDGVVWGKEIEKDMEMPTWRPEGHRAIELR